MPPEPRDLAVDGGGDARFLLGAEILIIGDALADMGELIGAGGGRGAGAAAAQDDTRAVVFGAFVDLVSLAAWGQIPNAAGGRKLVPA